MDTDETTEQRTTRNSLPTSIGVWVLYVAIAAIIVITIVFMIVYTFYKDSKQPKQHL